MSDAFSAGFREFCGGVQHAVSLHRILLFYLKSRHICVSSVKCFVLNGLIFLGSIYFFDRAVIPVIHMFGELLHRSFSYGTTTQVDDVRDRVDGFVFILYQVLWMYPIYCISFILNTIWYQEIADDAYMQLHGKPSPTVSSRSKMLSIAPAAQNARATQKMTCCSLGPAGAPC
ncbi:Etoposide-induced protein 2.4 (EI24) [Phytophthora infestans]|uniref:Etoposide-induced protein 2.4 (EI24) n=1 Tax=Phytophthora infestans TaxID=4787 RepID=A0A8S9U8C6_PHYIN|nr:Etoposide-induced protein 2.4 (EI24) [Phytophthora infestans]